MILQTVIYFYFLKIAEENLLLRFIDDSLFITPDLEMAKQFTRLSAQGFPKYGSYINMKKTLVWIIFTYFDNQINFKYSFRDEEIHQVSKKILINE